MSNARAARRREQKATKHAIAETPKRFADTPQIRLDNPMAANYGAFVVASAFAWETFAHDELQRVDLDAAESLEPYWGLAALAASNFADRGAMDQWRRFRRLVDERCAEKFVVERDSAKGQHIVICGAGPSLADEAAEWIPQADQVWGCNSALTWLFDNGYQATHGFTVDQTPDMLEEWARTFDVEYLLATTVHPHLLDHLRSDNRRLRWFHNYVGLKGDPVSWPDENGVEQTYSAEDWRYMLLFPGTVRAGSGLNAVTRAIDVAITMGAGKVTVLGADCAMRVKSRPPKGMIHGSPKHIKWLKENTTFHADGGHALASNSTALTMGAEVDSGTPDETIRPGHGRWWESKIDLLISAVWLVQMEKHYKGRVSVVGDTYVASIRGKNREYLERLPGFVDAEGRAMPINLGEEV